MNRIVLSPKILEKVRLLESFTQRNQEDDEGNNPAANFGHLARNDLQVGSEVLQKHRI